MVSMMINTSKFSQTQSSKSPVDGLSLSPFELDLLNRFQHDFPLEPQPYLAIARALQTDEATVIETLMSMQVQGVVSRVGAVFRPNRVAVSCLAAMRVDISRIDEVAAIVSSHPAVNHNYQREHVYTLWFVISAADQIRLRAVADELERACHSGAILLLPLVEEYHIDLGFDLLSPGTPSLKHRVAQNGIRSAARPLLLTQRQHHLIQALQQGLRFCSRPFSSLGDDEEWVLQQLRTWKEKTLIKRFGIVVRHQELGYRANAMMVFDVPVECVRDVGQRVAASGLVSLCYQRKVQAADWPYRLFCMLHGKDRVEVSARAQLLIDVCRLHDYPHDILFSLRRFKQCGAYYAAPSQLGLSGRLPDLEEVTL